MQADIEAGMELGEWLTYQALTSLRKSESLEPQQAYLVAGDLVQSACHARVGHAPKPADRWDVVYQATIAATHSYLLARSNGIGLLYTFGYTTPGTGPAIEQLVALDVSIADIRYSPNSRVQKWRKSSLQNWLGDHYLHIRELGNVNYNQPGAPIQLFQSENGVSLVSERLQRGQHLALMCMCREVEECHRLEAAREVQVQFPEVMVIHL